MKNSINTIITKYHTVKYASCKTEFGAFVFDCIVIPALVVSALPCLVVATYQYATQA